MLATVAASQRLSLRMLPQRNYLPDKAVPVVAVDAPG